MLSVNKPIMQQTFSNMLQEDTGMLYKAAYDAYMASMNDVKDMSNDDPEMEFQIANANSEMNKLKDKKSKEFAKAFVNSLKESGFDTTLANQIDQHVKSIQLLITMLPQGIATLISPMGPCTGTMVISDATANIQVL